MEIGLCRICAVIVIRIEYYINHSGNLLCAKISSCVIDITLYNITLSRIVVKK